MTIAAGGRNALPRRVGRLSLARRMMTAALAAGAATALAVVASGGTYALLNSSETTAGGTLRSGTATLGVVSGSALSIGAARLQPGTSVNGSAVVKNTGNVPLSLGIASLTGPTPATGFSSALVVGVSVLATGGTCPAVSTTWSKTIAQAAPLDLGIRLGLDESKLVCVSVLLPLDAPAASNIGTPIAFTLSVDGRQVL